MEQLLTNRKFHFCYHRNCRVFFGNGKRPLSSVSLGSYNGPKRNWKQSLCIILGWQTKNIAVCCGIFCSGQLRCVFLWEHFLKVFGSWQLNVCSGTWMTTRCVVNAIIFLCSSSLIIPNASHAQSFDYLRVERSKFCHVILTTNS